MIRLTGHIDVPSDRVQSVIAALPDHIRLTRAEPGCMSFEVTPDPTIPGRFLVAETFASRTDFEAHQTRTKASPWARITAGIPRDYRVEDVD